MDNEDNNDDNNDDNDDDPGPLRFAPIDEARLKKMARTNQTIVLYIAMHGGYTIVENKDNYGHDVARFDFPDKLEELHHVSIGSFARLNVTDKWNIWVDEVQDFFSKHAVTKKNILTVANFLAGHMKKVIRDKVDDKPDWISEKSDNEKLAIKKLAERKQQRRQRLPVSASSAEVREWKNIIKKRTSRRKSLALHMDEEDDERVHMRSYTFIREKVRNKRFSCMHDEIIKGMGMYILNYPPHLKHEGKTPLTFDPSMHRKGINKKDHKSTYKVRSDVENVCKTFSDFGFENVVIIDPSCNSIKTQQHQRYRNDDITQFIEDFNNSVSAANSLQFDRNIDLKYRKIKNPPAKKKRSKSSSSSSSSSDAKSLPKTPRPSHGRPPSARTRTRKIKSA